MKRMDESQNGIDEAELIAYHLGELSRWRMSVVRRALENDAALAAESEAIAETLRAFGADAPAPVVDAAALERSWQRVRPSLAVWEVQPQPKVYRWRFAVAGFMAAVLLMAGLSVWGHRVLRVNGPEVAEVEPELKVATVQPAAEQQVISELHQQHVAPRRYNNRPGPLTMAPVGEEDGDAAIAAHMDSAERLLTQVSHVDGPLPVETRTEVHRLLLENALYQRTAQARGDQTSASVMDDLGRVLITLDAAPPRTPESADSLRLQMNVGGVLFDLRILHHNKRSEAE